MSRSRSDRIALAVVAPVLLLAGCAEIGAPGVEVQSLQASVVFGVELPEEDGPVASPVTAIDDGVIEGGGNLFDDGSLTLPFRNRIPDRFKGVPFRVPAPEAVDCPEAGIGASPAVLAPEEVTGEPREGLYKWKRDITITMNVQGTEVVQRTEGFENRVIRAVEVSGEGTDPTDEQVGRQFSYEMVRPDGTGAVLVDRYRVNTDPIERGSSISQDPRGASHTAEETVKGAGVPLDVPDEAQDQIPAPNRVRVGEPNRGLTLTGRTTYDGNGQAQGTFNPAPPALMLPFPVQVGDEWSSTSVSNSGQTYRVAGIVNERESVDACGTMLDGWRAELDIVDASTAGAAQRTEDLVVSTQFGGMPIAQRIVEQGTDAAGNPIRLEATYSIAQVDPDPIPEGGLE